jgi:predicted acyl esterase
MSMHRGDHRRVPAGRAGTPVFRRYGPANGDNHTVIAIELFRIANLFRLWHRLRLDISSSISTSTRIRASPKRDGICTIALSRVFVDTDRPSHLVLPVIRQSREADRRFIRHGWA